MRNWFQLIWKTKGKLINQMLHPPQMSVKTFIIIEKRLKKPIRHLECQEHICIGGSFPTRTRLQEQTPYSESPSTLCYEQFFPIPNE